MATFNKTINFTQKEIRHFRLAAFDVAALAGSLKTNGEMLVSNDTGEIVDYSTLIGVMHVLKTISSHSFTVEKDEYELEN